MQKEERLLDTSLETIIQRVQELRNSVNMFILKLENEYMTLNWLNVLDNFALLSGQISMLSRILKSDKIAPLRNYAVIPRQLYPDRDPALEKLTENRLKAFNHEAAPLYLRTKPNPEVEDRVLFLCDKANKVSADHTLKQTTNLNKLCCQAEQLIKTFKESSESDVQKHSLPQLSSPADTSALISAIVFGKGIKTPQRLMESSGVQGSNGGSGGSQQQQSLSAEQQRMNAHSQQAGSAGAMQMGKAPSSIKTTIKAASNTHPYAR